MSDQVIVFVADEKFYPHVKSLAVNCRRQGEYTGDFLLIHPDDIDPAIADDFTERGWWRSPVTDRGFLQKFNLFSPDLKKWRQALFLDADCLVQRPLSLIFEQLESAKTDDTLLYPPGSIVMADGTDVSTADMARKFFAEIANGAEINLPTEVDERGNRKWELRRGLKPILADREEMPAFLSWRTWDADHESHGLKVIQNPDTSLSPMLTEGSLYHRIAQQFPHVVSERMWNTSMVAWEPGSIADGTVEQLRALQAEFGECNRPEKGGTDQQILDLLLHNQIRLMPDKLICYWGLDEKASRVASAGRGWNGTEVPAVIHMARWYANWLVKASNADAYFNDRLGVVNHEFYLQNLADFETVFPKE
jgi:hypothetical protein